MRRATIELENLFITSR